MRFFILCSLSILALVQSSTSGSAGGSGAGDTDPSSAGYSNGGSVADSGNFSEGEPSNPEDLRLDSWEVIDEDEFSPEERENAVALYNAQTALNTDNGLHI